MTFRDRLFLLINDMQQWTTQSGSLWTLCLNDLPPTLRASVGMLRQFQSTLKTILFCSAYGTWFSGFLLLCRIHFPWLFQTKWI